MTRSEQDYKKSLIQKMSTKKSMTRNKKEREISWSYERLSFNKKKINDWPTCSVFFKAKINIVDKPL